MYHQVSVSKLPKRAPVLPMNMDDSVSHSMWWPANKIYENTALLPLKALSFGKKAIKVSAYEAGWPPREQESSIYSHC